MCIHFMSLSEISFMQRTCTKWLLIIWLTYAIRFRKFMIVISRNYLADACFLIFSSFIFWVREHCQSHSQEHDSQISKYTKQMFASDFRSLQNHINYSFKDWDLHFIFRFASECQAHKISSTSQAIRNEKASCQILQTNIK